MPTTTDISTLFDTRTDGSNVSTISPLKRILRPLLGGEVAGVSTQLDRLLALSNVEAISTFDPKDCNRSLTPNGDSSNVNPDQPSDQEGDDNSHDEGTEEIPDTPHVFLALARMEDAVRDMKNALYVTRTPSKTGSDEGQLVDNTIATSRDADSPLRSCYEYQSTLHGPTGLFRFSDVLFVRVNGTVQTLAGINTYAGNANVLTRVDYSVNTYLKGVPAWVIDEKSGDAVPPTPREVSLEVGERRCQAAEAKNRPCRSEEAVGVLEVFVRFKKVFIGTLAVIADSKINSVEIETAMLRQTEAEFRGTVPFTHFVGANSTGSETLQAPT